MADTPRMRSVYIVHGIMKENEGSLLFSNVVKEK